MLIDREPDTLAEGEPDPATPERRAELARGLLLASIRRYDEVSKSWGDVRESYPTLAQTIDPRDDAEVAERRAWRGLLREVDDEFNLAEQALAGRIQGLYDALAAEGSRVGDQPEAAEGYFVPRAVKHGGTLYVLTYSINEYEAETNIVAVYRGSMVVDLDAAVSP